GAWGREAPPVTTRTDIGPGGAAHVPVLVGEVVEWLRPRPGARLVDATVGLGGHAAALLAAAPGARLLGLDRDPAALARAAEQLPGERVVLRQARFSQLSAVLAELEWDGADAVLLDLGVSSLQLDDPARGFSFQADGPLDMRMDPGSGPRAAEIVNQWSEREIAHLLAELGDAPPASSLAARDRAQPARAQCPPPYHRAAGGARMNRSTGAAARALAVRRPLARPAAHPARLLRAMRGWLVRRALGLGAVLVGLCLLQVWLRLQVTHVGYELSAARDMQLRLEHEHRELEVELATLRDPGRLGDLARRRLGMQEPGKGQVVILR